MKILYKTIYENIISNLNVVNSNVSSYDTFLEFLYEDFFKWNERITKWGDMEDWAAEHDELSKWKTQRKW